MNESDTYRESPPPEAWKPMVACLWEQRIGTDTEYRVVPDGCADVILGGGGDAIAVGLADSAVIHHISAGSSAFGLRLKPQAVSTLFGASAEELCNIEVPLDDVVGSRRARRLADTVRGGDPDPLLFATPPGEVVRAIELLAERTVEETAAMLGFSSRHLYRLLMRHTGLSPKKHQRVMRLRRFLENPAPLGVAAVLSGYSDQAHLTREVKRLCGVSPARLRVERRTLQIHRLRTLSPREDLDLDLQLWKGQSAHPEEGRGGQIGAEEFAGDR